MPDDQRVYSDEEFALILRKATELASRAEPAATSSAGLTLAEMKAAAAQVGFDPGLVERAARLVIPKAPASPLERLLGGPLRHDLSARFPVRLSDDRAALLLSSVRISGGVAGRQDAGHAGAMGMTWHDGGDPEALRVMARPGEDDAVVSIVLDRRGTLGLVATASGVTVFLTVLFAGSVYPEAPVLAWGGAVAGIGGTLALARGYWASSTRKARERIGVVMDAITQALAQPAPPSLSRGAPENP
jgi:hypothetical protein